MFVPTLLQIAQLGHPVLRKKAKPVLDFADPNLATLIANMMVTVIDVDGVGLAAPQVYHSQRIFIMASHPNPRYPNAPDAAPFALCNPKLLSHSKEKVTDWEGCLSIPGVRGLVPRWRQIVVSYQDSSGKTIKKTYQEFLARIFQHELDHLDGLMFLDRVATTKDIYMEKEYQKLLTQKA